MSAHGKISIVLQIRKLHVLSYYLRLRKFVAQRRPLISAYDQGHKVIPIISIQHRHSDLDCRNDEFR
jgi:hypothetical protein